MKEVEPKAENTRPHILKRMANLLMGPSIVVMPITEASLRKSTVDREAFGRLRNLSDDTPVEDVLRDLEMVTNTTTELT